MRGRRRRDGAGAQPVSNPWFKTALSALRRYAPSHWSPQSAVAGFPGAGSSAAGQETQASVV